MKKNQLILWAAVFFLAALFSCNRSGSDNSAAAFEQQLQEKLRQAKKGDVIEIPEGKFEFTRTLSLVGVPFVTIRGKAQSQTVLSFKNQTEGEEGLRIANADDFTIENISIHDSRGDGIKLQDSKNVIIRNLAVGWTKGPKETNGSYGIYPLSCENVLIEKCAVTAASDAGIYVGQSENIIVRNNITFENVAGIEIKNCTYADVYNNKSYNNSGGIFVCDLPELPVKNGHHIRIYENVVKDNNYQNFAPGRNTVAMVPSGTGMLLMSARNVEVFENEFSGHRTTSAAVISYLLTKKSYKDSLYNPYTSSVFIHHNKFDQPMAMPDTTCSLGRLAADIFHGNNPHILFDGFIDPSFVEKDGKVRESGNLCLKLNGDIKFANINAPSDFKDIKTDPNVHDCEHGEIPAVELY